MTWGTAGLGALCAFPIMAILCFRAARLWPRMDARARKKLGLESAAFAAASLAASVLLVWKRGSLAAPALAEVLAVVVTAFLLVASLLARRDR